MMNKVQYWNDQESLLREAGQMMNLIETDRHVKSAASNTLTREMLDAHKPDKDHFLLHVIALGDHEHFGCLFAGTPVQTIDGFKPIEEIKIGDWAMTHNNRYRQVAEVFQEPYSGPAVRIKCRDLPEAEEATANHPYRVVRKEQFTTRHRAPSLAKHRQDKRTKNELINDLAASAEFVRGDSIRPGDFMIVPVGDIPTSTQIDIALAGPAGFYLAEGCVYDERRDISSKGQPKGCVFVVHKKKDYSRTMELLEMQQAKGLTAGFHPSQSSEEAGRVEFCNQEFALEMVRLFGRHSTTKKIHPDIFGQTREWKLKFLAGYFDGDGCLITDASHPRYENVLTASTASRNLAHDLQRLLANCGISSSVSLSFNRESNGCFGRGDFPIYSISVGGSQSPIILQYTQRLKALTTIEKTAQGSTHTSGRYMLVPVSSVEHYEVKDTVKYNFETDGDHTFVTRTLSHNSNRNSDSFPKAACEKYHPTFVSHGHYFREHRNRDPKQSIGSIKAACYNADMGRVELAVWGHVKKAEDVLQKLKDGKPIGNSMSCRVPTDRSSITGRLAKSPADYDDYCKYRMGQYIPEHKKFAFVYNDHPTFFDISDVKNPADRIAYTLEGMLPKAASASLLTGVDLASAEGVNLPGTGRDPYRQQLIEKLAALETYLDHVDREGGTDERALFAKHAARRAFRGEITEAQLAAFKSVSPGTLFRKLASREVILPFISFAAYATGRTVAEAAAHPGVRAAQAALPQIFTKLAACPACAELEDMCEPSSEFLATADLGAGDMVDKAMAQVTRDFSTQPAHVKSRVIFNTTAPAPAPVEKSAASDGESEILTRAYACYQLSALQAIQSSAHSESSEPRNILVLSHNRSQL